MVTPKKKKKASPVQVIMLVVIAAGLIWQVSDLFMSEEVMVEQVAISETQSKQKVSNEDKSSVAKLPIRMRSAPDYDDILMAAKIYKQAINQQESKHFINLKMSERNIALTAKIIKMQREIAENSFKKAEFAKRQDELDVNPEYSKGAEPTSFVSNNEYPSILSTEQLTSAPEDAVVDDIRIVGWSNSGRIAMTNNDLPANNVNLNQVLWGRYLVKEINTELSCVSLFDEKANKKIPMICFN